MTPWTPFLGPAPGVQSWWWLLVLPLSVFVSMAWKAVRQEDMRGYWGAVARMSAQVVLGMLAMTAALAFVVRVLVPLIPAE
ncbi:MAG: hypothetical protein EBU70_13740 [Actinobacteria bacterium]|nr:hypothetical protein [Actinomycetota bacterium]